MESLTVLTAVEQVAEHLRRLLLRGSLSGTMPGANPLAAEFGINHKTVEAALRQLEGEGLLVNQGRGVQRRIVLPEDHAPPALRVAILDFDFASQGEADMIELRHQLEEAGHVPFYPDKSLQDLGMDVGRVARFVNKTEADAWIVVAASQGVVGWFAQQEMPAFALFGGRDGLRIAGTGPDKAPVMVAAIRHLVTLGHRRISFLCRSQVRLPQPTKSVCAFLGALEAAGIETGAFNLPEWEEGRESFGRALDSLFGGPTPPTTLILDEPFLYHAALHYLARRGLRVPKDVSLVCTDGEPGFAWCDPSVAHIRWDYRPVVRRVVRWTNNVAKGKNDRRQSFTQAEFVDGGTIGPVAGNRMVSVE